MRSAIRTSFLFFVISIILNNKILQSIICADTPYSASLKSLLFYKGLRSWGTVRRKKESFKVNID